MTGPFKMTGWSPFTKKEKKETKKTGSNLDIYAEKAIDWLGFTKQYEKFKTIKPK